MSADASSFGIGAVLMQQDKDVLKPVAFASRTLLPAETRYAQIEKECLASVWACEKFDRYLCGLQSFRLLTDHKPLVPLINGSDLNTVPMRCQRLLMRMMRYNPVAEHVPGKQLIVADTLSRHPVQQTNVADSELCQEVNLYVDSITTNWPVSYDRLEEIRKATKSDETMQQAIQFTIEGWPENIKELSEDLRNFYSVRSHLSVADNLLIHDGKIVIPKALQAMILEVIHHGHLGINKCRERANTSVWWYGLSNDLKDMIKRCKHCQIQKPSQNKEPLLSTPLPDTPWSRVGADLLYFKGSSYIVVMDYYSRYLELAYMSETTSMAVIAKLKAMFARWGIPHELVSDNGPQFSAESFTLFSRNYGFKHITSSPHYPQSNGMAEAAVKIAKSILKQSDPFLALMVYRATPLGSTGYSPSEIMLNRQIRTTLPALTRNYEFKPYNPEIVQQRDASSKRKSEYFYNRHFSTKHLPPLQPGDVVRLKTDKDKQWGDHAVIVDKADSPRSYQTATEKGIVRRNRRHIMLVPDPDPLPDVQDDDGENPAHTLENRTRSGRLVKPPDRLDI